MSRAILHERVTGFLADFDARGFYPEVVTISAGVNEPVCRIDGADWLMFGANNYLGLTEHPAIKRAACTAIERYGLGPGGSRIISGNVDVIEELEARIAELTGTEDCLTFPTGYMANIAVFRALADGLMGGQPVTSGESVIFADQYSHGSMLDGCRMAEAPTVIFRHNDLADLETKLARSDRPNKLIAIEGVYCLTGEIADVPAYVGLARRYDAALFVDDAHGVGILGRHGGGVGEHFGCAPEIDILMGCMDKAFGGSGGYLCGSRSIIRYLRIAARSSLLSSALPTVLAGAMIEAASQISRGQELRERLFANADYLRSKLREDGFSILGTDALPALALYLGPEERGIAFARGLAERRIHCPVIRWPAVPRGQSRLRINVMATHQRAHLDAFALAAEEVGHGLAIR